MSREEFLAGVELTCSDPAETLESILTHFHADTGTVHFLGSDGMLRLQASCRVPDHLKTVIETIPVGKGIAGLTVERRHPVDMCNLQTDASGQARPGARATGVKGAICVPMWSDDQVVGALGIATVEERQFDDQEVELLLEVGRRLAAASPASGARLKP